MSGTQWIYLREIDCFELLAIGILELVDNGRQTKQGSLSLRVSGEDMEKIEKKGKREPGSAVTFTCDF